MTSESSTSFERLKSIIDTLRGPQGCPWDRKQTHDSLKTYLIEECYEVLQAIDSKNPQKLCEELGDLLLQIMLHARIAEEEGKFDINTVMDKISDKLIRRHPHVFDGKRDISPEEINYNWHNLKQEEPGKESSILSGLPDTMPALTYSQLIQRKVAGVGFDWDETEDILDKLVEEVTELVKAKDDKDKRAEFGDILFVLVNIARRMGIDAEMALQEANQRFFKRFAYMERVCRDKGKRFADLSFEEQNALWDEAKKGLVDGR